MIFLDSQSTIHRFVFRTDDASVRSVSVAGTFNGWSKDATPLKLESDGKTWDVPVPLQFGKIEYKFVLNGSQWVVDSAAPAVSDGNGNTNSEVLVTPDDYSVPASPNDGITAKSALLHVPAEPLLNYDRGEIEIKLRARPDDLAEIDVLANGKRSRMAEVSRDEVFATYRADIPWSRSGDLSYNFELHDGGKVAYYGPSGYGDTATDRFELSAKKYKPFTVPNWVDRTVLYQIFPDRFADGDKTNDPKDVQAPQAAPTWFNRFGGDVAGVRQHLDYLKSLGIGGVYFNPVFASPSNHRYDTTDYEKIDPEFGTNDEFDGLTKAFHKVGIRTVMDFAFNHTAPSFFAFQDIEKNGPQSRFLNWYFIKSFPVTEKANPPYEAWSGYASMPKLNVVNPETEKYLLGVIDFWRTHAGLDGARLDVANEVNPKLWRDLRDSVKKQDPNFWIVGEEWGDANPWLKGDQWDSTMGYQFRQACVDFFAQKSAGATQFIDRLSGIYESYPPQVARNLMNLLGSHDTPRFLTLCKGDIDELKLAATVQLTWPGTPCIYYGDEIGMQGGADPENRRMMDWSVAAKPNPTLDYYKLLIQARNRSSALEEGDPVILTRDDRRRSFAYGRIYRSDVAIVAVNDSSEPQTISLSVPAGKSFDPFRTRFFDIIGRRGFALANPTFVTLPPKGAAVLLPEKEHDSSTGPVSANRAAAQNFPRTLKSNPQPRS